VLTAAAQQPAAQKVASIAGGKDMNVLVIVSAVIMLMAGALVSIERRLKRS